MRVAVLLAGACGCGGNGKPDGARAEPDAPVADAREYERSMRAAVTDLAEVFAIGFGFIEVDNDCEAEVLAREMATGYRRIADRLRRIDPPPDVASSHEDGIGALDRTAQGLEAWSEADDRDDFELSSAIEDERLNKSLSQIQARYDIGWK